MGNGERSGSGGRRNWPVDVAGGVGGAAGGALAMLVGKLADLGGFWPGLIVFLLGSAPASSWGDSPVRSCSAGHPVTGRVNGRLDFGLFLAGTLAGAVLGFLSGAQVVRFGGPNGRQSDVALARLLLIAAGALVWLCLWAVIGMAVGSWLSRADAMSGGIDAILRDIAFTRWGALVGSFVGYGLLSGVRVCFSSKGALAAENERLRDEVARLRENRA
jgi:hypothetical protein